MPSTKLKIILVGPKACGKSSIANFVMGQSENLNPTSSIGYQPTVGVRILENDFAGSNNQIANVELWDASGDHRYEACWKAIMVDSDGVVLVYNPDAPAQDQQLIDWFDFFVKKNGLKEEQCLIFAHRSNPGNNDRIRPPPLFSRVSSMVSTNQSGEDVKNKFTNFVKDISISKQRK